MLMGDNRGVFFVALERQARKTFAFFLTFTIGESQKKAFPTKKLVFLKKRRSAQSETSSRLFSNGYRRDRLSLLMCPRNVRVGENSPNL